MQHELNSQAAAARSILLLIVGLVVVMLVAAALFIFQAYLAYILIGLAALGFTVAVIALRIHFRNAAIPRLVAEQDARRVALEEKNQHHTHTLEWDAHEHQKRIQLEQHEQGLRLQQEQHWLAQHLALTRIPADAKQHFYIRDEQGGYQALPNLNMRQIAGPKVPDEDETGELVTALPKLVRYEDIRAQIPRGHTLLGVSSQGIETRPFSILSTCWIVGGSKTGKTTTVSLKVDEAYRQGCWFAVIDPHRHKDDSLYNSIKGYEDRFLAPGVAVTDKETLAVLKAFLAEAQARINGTSKERTPIILLADEVGHICDIVGLEGEELEIAQEIVALFKKISRMCGQELRGYMMFGWFISQTATGLAWLRKNAMTVIAHKVLMMSERKLACNEMADIARSMDTWPIGRVLIYGLDFPDGHLITQMAQFTPRIVDADPPKVFTPERPVVNAFTDSVNAWETPSDAPSLRLVPNSVNVYEEESSQAQKKVDTSKVGNDIRQIIMRMSRAGTPLGEIAKMVGLNGRYYPIFQAVCVELGIKKVEEA